MHSLALAQSFQEKDKSIRDIMILSTTPYAFISVYGLPGLLRVDYTSMTVKSNHGGLPSGILAPMDKDMTLTKCVLAH